MLLDVSGEVQPPYMPPGVPGWVTVTAAVPAVAMSAPGMVAVSWFALTCVVVCAVPFQLMAALPLKLVPSTVITKDALPAAILFGARSLMLGIVPATAGVVACLL